MNMYLTSLIIDALLAVFQDIDASSAFFSNALKKIPTASNSDESLVVKKKKAPQIVRLFCIFCVFCVCVFFIFYLFLLFFSIRRMVM